jgi:hypothetical protein
MYQIVADGQLAVVPYAYHNLSPAEAAGAPAAAGFYQIVEDGTVIESGYQQFVSYENELFYMVALPNILPLNSDTISISVKIWDAGALEWKVLPGFVTQLTCDQELINATCVDCGLVAPTAPAGYTLWANLDAVNNGEKYRFVIKEVNA